MKFGSVHQTGAGWWQSFGPPITRHCQHAPGRPSVWEPLRRRRNSCAPIAADCPLLGVSELCAMSSSICSMTHGENSTWNAGCGVFVGSAASQVSAFPSTLSCAGPLPFSTTCNSQRCVARLTTARSREGMLALHALHGASCYIWLLAPASAFSRAPLWPPQVKPCTAAQGCPGHGDLPQGNGYHSCGPFVRDGGSDRPEHPGGLGHLPHASIFGGSTVGRAS